MIDYYMYDSSGRIIMRGVTSRSSAPVHPSYTTAVGQSNMSKQYVVDDVLVDRPSMGVTIDKVAVAEDEVITISNIVAGTDVYINKKYQGTVNDGTLLLSFDMIGDYYLSLNKFPYVDYEVLITCS